MKFKGNTKMQALINSNSKVNVIIFAYAAVLELRICLTDVGAYKIDGFTFSTYSMVLAIFQFKDK